MDEKDIKRLIGKKKKNIGEYEFVVTEKDKLRAKCDHKKKEKGRLYSALNESSSDRDQCKCGICATCVNLRDMSMIELNTATDKLFNAIQCIKIAYPDATDDELEAIATLQILLSRVSGWYKKHYLERDRRDEGKFNNNNNNGSVNGARFIKTLSPMMNNNFGFSGSNTNNNYKSKDKKKKNKNKW